MDEGKVEIRCPPQPRQFGTYVLSHGGGSSAAPFSGVAALVVAVVVCAAIVARVPSSRHLCPTPTFTIVVTVRHHLLLLALAAVDRHILVEIKEFQRPLLAWGSAAPYAPLVVIFVSTHHLLVLLFPHVRPSPLPLPSFLHNHWGLGDEGRRKTEREDREE
ncbi:hypothetical protein BHE74_00011918 [Ensete ventricosum]|uniref:Uncharacterized protein n=1 Tax=Ensete ventricosum TaxID=4639 RepID=A0A427B122_ENSVE|nr:hypothetical protein B296_00017346 [Ensete ventricosum]RWW79773.1 hypothetical protein BHE74_00011918 [Ensete ventricosum]